MPKHLRGHSVHEAMAAGLSERLVALSSNWEIHDAHQRAVLAGAVGYVLAVGDAMPDGSDDGLLDDEAVVAAAERTLAGR